MSLKKTHTKIMLALCVLMLLALGSLVFKNNRVSAACDALPTTNGTATATVSVPVTGNYRVWVRMMTPDTTNDTVYVEVQDQSCGNLMGGSGFTANTWRWVDYKDGSSSSKVNVNNLSAGNHVVKLTGAEAGVKVDRVLLLTDTGCTPTGTGNNCSGTPDTTAPTASVTAPSNGATVSGTVNITANASDVGSQVESVQFFIDGSSVGTDSSSPYSYSWNTTQVSDGQHTIYAVARDQWNNPGTSSTITVNVANNPTGSAALSFSPASGNFEPNGTMTVQVMVNSGEDTMTSAQARVTYDTTKLSYASTSTAQSGFNTNGTTTTGSGYVQASRSNSSAISGSRELVRITFNVLPGASGSTGLAFASSASQTWVRLNSDNLTVIRNTGSYTVNDTTNPSTPAGLTATPVGGRIDLSWNASTDNVGVTRYIIQRNGSTINSNVTGTTYSDSSSVIPGTTYTYRVRAVDAAGNQSSLSTQASAATTAKVGDFNSDGQIGIADLSIFLNNWGKSTALTDLNSDGTTGIADLSIFLNNWGK